MTRYTAGEVCRCPSKRIKHTIQQLQNTLRQSHSLSWVWSYLTLWNGKPQSSHISVATTSGIPEKPACEMGPRWQLLIQTLQINATRWRPRRLLQFVQHCRSCWSNIPLCGWPPRAPYWHRLRLPLPRTWQQLQLPSQQDGKTGPSRQKKLKNKTKNETRPWHPGNQGKLFRTALDTFCHH